MKRRVRNLHWKAIPKNKLDQTIWSTMGNENDVIDTTDLEEEMLDIFSLSPEKSVYFFF